MTRSSTEGSQRVTSRFDRDDIARWRTVKEFAVWLGAGERSVRRWLADGNLGLDAVRVGGLLRVRLSPWATSPNGSTWHLPRLGVRLQTAGSEAPVRESRSREAPELKIAAATWDAMAPDDQARCADAAWALCNVFGLHDLCDRVMASMEVYTATGRLTTRADALLRLVSVLVLECEMKIHERARLLEAAFDVLAVSRDGATA